MSTNATTSPVPESVQVSGAIQVLVSEDIPFVAFVEALSTAGLQLRFDGAAGELRITASLKSKSAAPKPKHLANRRPARRLTAASTPTAKRARAPRVAASTAH